MADTDTKYKFFHYVPSMPGAIIFASLFAITSIWHFKQLSSHKSWYFLPLFIGGIMEVIGYIGRVIAHGNITLGPYIMQSMMILLAPALFAASIYVVLGRLIVALNAEDLSLIRVSRLTKVFVLGDAFCFFLQCSGGGLSVMESQADLGNAIVLVGLGIQITWFGFFMVVAAVFHVRMRQRPIRTDQTGWSKLLWVLYVASAFILIRSVFRLVEFAGGRDGVLMQKEIYLYIFDALLMFIVMAVFNVFHPGQVVGQLVRSKEGYQMGEL